MLITICVCGCPGSGKTTTSRWLIDRIHSYDFIDSVEYLCSDDFESALSEQQDSSCFDHIIWKDARASLICRLNELRSMHVVQSPFAQVVIIDDTLHYKSMRKQLMPNIIIFMDTPLDRCISRNSQRANPVPPDIIEKCYNLFERPPCKGTWESNTVCYSGAPADADDFKIVLLRLFNQKRARNESTPQSVKVEIQSERHSIDLQMRRLISQKLTKNKSIGNLLNEKRKYFLKMIQAEGGGKILQEFADYCDSIG
jgi:tRNA uridine 5-carbamoylmethylation protein Kti12